MPDLTALTRLVQEHVGDGRPMTIRAFAELAIDPETGISISKSTVGNLVQGHTIKITPAVLRAVAAGLGLPLVDVQLAATQQYVGLLLDDPFDTPSGDTDAVVRVAHKPGQKASDMPATRKFVEQAQQADARDAR